MILRHRKAGEPLIALALLLAGWVGARVLVADSWSPVQQPAVRSASQQAAPPAPAPIRAGTAARPADGNAPIGDVAAARAASLPPAGLLSLPASPPLAPPSVVAPPPVAPPVTPPVPLPGEPAAMLYPAAAARPGTLPAEPAARMAVAGGHQLLWLAATAYLPLPPLGLRSPSANALGMAVPARRWSGDGWMLLRRGDGRIAPGPIVGNYGASQAGAVLRYRLDPADRHRASTYVRATAALNGTREQQVALGLSGRPLPRVPLTAMAELRQVRDSAGERLRPAVAVITELPPQRLPLGFTGELYAQAGYVGGRNATGFVDALVRAERPVTELGRFRLQAGGGAWAAKQRGASRVDVGPTASVSFRLSDTASARLAADWRFRVGGRSKPDSGPAVTLSAGF